MFSGLQRVAREAGEPDNKTSPKQIDSRIRTIHP